jgi:hypothetical protein
MQRIVRLAFLVLGLVIVLLGFGYVWGASGRSGIQTALEETRQQFDISEARRYVLDARVSLYNMNFGDASSKLEEAKAPLRRIRQRHADDGKDDAVRSLAAALEHVEEAQRLAGKLDPAANSKAGEALEAIRVATSE